MYYLCSNPNCECSHPSKRFKKDYMEGELPDIERSEIRTKKHV
jgi:hypothetical protein